MSRKPKVRYATQSSRRRRQAWLRFGVWIFIFVFAFSLIAGLIIFIR